MTCLQSKKERERMDAKKLPEREQVKDTFTLRIPSETNQKIKTLSNEIGLSQNALILFFINAGIKGYEQFILHQREEFRHFLLQNQK